jgi:glycosyltransferase involved in cell wall biosynthesis
MATPANVSVVAAPPRVTVIIATYNWSSVLPYAVGSVLQQTFRDFELLVIGDGCTDDSESVVTAIEDPRVRWINLPTNFGHQAGPNNRGLTEAQGEIIAYLGHDDLWLPHHLECLLAALDGSGAAMAYSLLVNIPADGDLGRPLLPMPQYQSYMPPTGTIHRRSMTERIGGWKDYRTLNMAPETELWARAHAAGFTSVFVPRLTALKFAASKRKDVYRRKPCHEQAAWLRRIQTEPDLEPTQLARIIVGGEAARAMPARWLIPLLFQELRNRLLWRLSPRSGLIALFWGAKGGGIDWIKRYKGLPPR